MDVETHKPPRAGLKAWLNAMRLRTLPLALSSTLAGAFLSMQQGVFSSWVFVLTLITTVLLQINSNLANDYGDFQHGTDNSERVGPMRALQSGSISELSMRRAIILCSIFAFAFGVWLLWSAPITDLSKIILLISGVAAIYASIRYTAGRKPYGYRGLGDLSVLVFFGILGVVGSYFVQTGNLEATLLLPALAIGCFSAAVLNVNNTRDLESDQKSGKITMAVKLGPKGARVYHVLLITSGMTMFLAYATITFNHFEDWLFLLAYPLFILNALKVFTNDEPAKLDPYLKQMALSTFLMVMLLGISVWLEQG